MITLIGLARRYASQTLFENVNLQLLAGHRYGVVGANGAGKSTLLRMLSGEESPSEGQITMPRAARVGVLAQDQFRYDDVPIQDVVMMGDDVVWRALQEQEALLAAPEINEGRFHDLEEEIARLGGYNLASRASAILEGLGLPTRLHRNPLRTLSGGFRLRVLLGQVLAGRPDLLLLDEPTNHLDIVSVAWLERFLASYEGCAVIVSHDRQFLTNAVSHTLDVDYGTITLYKGNYPAFQLQKTETRARKEQEIARRKALIAEQEAWILRFKATATKARQAQSRAKQVAKMTLEELPGSSRQAPTFRFAERRPSGREVLTVKNVWRSYGENLVLAGVSFTVQRGEKVAIVGPNGAGKSTLLKILAGVLPPDQGQAAWGYEAWPGYFPQDHRDLLTRPDQTVLSWYWDQCPGDTVGAVRGRLAEVLFSQGDVDKRCSVLSGGEAARLILAGLGRAEPNVLLLDEPTNHLDLEAVEALAQGLRTYPGTLLLVSHNRWLVEQCANRIIEVTPGGVRDFPGTWAEYLAKQGADHLDQATVVAAARQAKATARPSAPAPAPPRPAAKAPPPAAPTAPAAAAAPTAAPPSPPAKGSAKKAAPKKPPPKPKTGPLWFEDAPEEQPQKGSWAELFSQVPARSGPKRGR